MSAVLKKGAPSRSYPSRQRKLGPAPFASFEDLSDELESPGVGAEDNKVNVMPEIKEDRYNERSGAACQSPTSMTPGGGDEDTPVAVRAHKNVTATSSSSTVTFAPSYSAPTSGPTSGLQTPSTPRIDISCASSSTPPSDESASEKELFQGGLGLAFHEEAVDDLRSSTEELDLGEEEISSEEERRRKRLEEQEMREQDIYRRSSHPANIFSRKASAPAAPPPPREEDDFQRKPSAHSLFLEGLLNRPCRHASFGHGDYIQRPGAVSSLSTHSAGSGYRSRSRSPSPHKLMFETSFCGSKPIPTKSMDQSSPPKEAGSSTAAVSAAIGAAAAAVANKQPCASTSSSASTSKPITPGVQSYSQPQSALGSAAATPTTSNRFDDRVLKSPKKMVVTPGWERHQAELEQVCREVTSAGSSAAGPKDIESVSRSKTPLSPQPSSLGFDSRRPSTGRRSVSPHKMLLETSFCGSKPIPTRSMEMESPPKDLPDLGALLAECNKLAAASNQSSTSQVNEHCHKTITTAQVHRHSSSGDRSSVISKEEDQQTPSQPSKQTRKSDAGQSTLGGGGAEWNSVPYLPGSPESPKSSDLWQPITPSPRLELRSPAFTTTTSPLSPSPHHRSPREDACSISSSSPQGLRGQEVSPLGRSPDNSYIQATSPSPATATRSSLTTKYNEDSKCSKEIDHSISATPSTTKKMFSQQHQGGSSSGGGGGGKSVGFQSEKSESSKDHDDDDGEITTEMQISEDPTVTVEDVPIESKGLFLQSDSFDEEGDLPYVPTTLPQEKSTGVAILPVSERKKMALMMNTMPVQRPKVNRPAAPASLNDYIEYSKNTLPKKGKGTGESGAGAGSKEEGSDEVVEKMKINLPREDSLTNSSGGKGKGPRKKSVPTTTWTDFANMGLLSPREIRRKMKEENGAVDDISSYHSDSSSTNDIPGAVDGAEEEAESLLKLPKVPFAMDLDVHSNRSSVISQDEVQKSPSECSALLGSPDEPDLGSKKTDSRE